MSEIKPVPQDELENIGRQLPMLNDTFGSQAVPCSITVSVKQYRAMVTELLQRRAQAVTVKPLEWEDSNEQGVQISSVSKRRIMERARHSFGAYFLEQNQDDDSWWAMKGLLGAEIDGPFEHDWQARAAAQAYHDERILAAVNAAPPPAQSAGVTEAMDALKYAAKGLDMIHDGLMDATRPRQSVGEVCAHFLEAATKAVATIEALPKEPKP